MNPDRVGHHRECLEPLCWVVPQWLQMGEMIFETCYGTEEGGCV